MPSACVDFGLRDERVDIVSDVARDKDKNEGDPCEGCLDGKQGAAVER